MTSPRSVIRGESPLSLPVCLDYFSFTVPAGDVGGIVREAVAFLGIESVEDRKRGMFGYRASLDLGGYGLIAYGGEAQRGTVLVSINGEGCRPNCGFRASAKLGRVFLALAYPAGHRRRRLRVRICGHSRAVEAWRQGFFTNGGRPPKARRIDDFGSGKVAVCTLDLGRAESCAGCTRRESN